MDDTRGHPRLALTSSVIGALTLIGGWSLAARLQAPGFDPAHDSISALAGASATHRWVMTTAFVVTGLCHLVTAWSLPHLRPRGRVVLALAGVATLGVAAAPLPDRGESTVVHTVIASLSFVLLALWPLWMGRSRRDRAFHREYAVFSLLVVAALGVVTVGWVDVAFGRAERWVTALLVAWPAIAAGLAWWRAGHRIGSRPARRAVTFGVVTVACALAGVAATAIAPVTAETRHYSAQVSLDPDPFASASLVAPTVFGDVDVSFRGLAPGIRATPQIKASITDVLGRPNVSITALAPGPLELDRAIKDVGLALGLRFLLGAGTVVAAAVLVATVRRRRWSGRGPLLRVLGAAVLATALTAASVAVTYRPDRVTGFASNGLLSTVQSNANLLDDVQNRSTQVAPYLTNLVALTGALQQRYSPAVATQPVALRLLLISDLHLGNQYPLVKKLVETEKVDAVVDSGDLVTFGTTEEAEAAGMFDGIASLGVPYFFVRGNHDATSATDTALLDRLAKIPNVVLLQRDAETFASADLNGIRIRGVNDTRWFGDDGKRTAAVQEPAIAAYESAVAGEPVPDLFVTHHPVGARTVPAGVTINGHMHSAQLEGHRIQVGSFTGGGPLTHYVATEDGSELTGQPSAFDLLTFDESCRASELTRFTFRNVIEGRPAYDQVALVNGRQIDTRPIGPARSCRAGGALRVTELHAEASAARGSEP